MRLSSPLSAKKACIEIIPLIDVMFFLLASFMMLSLSMQRLKTMKMDLPSAVKATSTKKPDMIEVKINRGGDISVDAKRLTLPDFMSLVKERLVVNSNVPVYIKADTMATHGDVLRVVDSAKFVGASKVSFQLDSVMASGK